MKINPLNYNYTGTNNTRKFMSNPLGTNNLPLNEGIKDTVSFGSEIKGLKRAGTILTAAALAAAPASAAASNTQTGNIPCTGTLIVAPSQMTSITPKNPLVKMVPSYEVGDDTYTTLREIISKNYSQGQDAEDYQTHKFLAEIIQANPTHMAEIYARYFEGGQYASIEEVPSEELLDKAFADELGDMVVVLPKVVTEDFTGDNLADTRYTSQSYRYTTAQNHVQLDENHSLESYITKLYGVKKNSYDYWFITGKVANLPLNAPLVESIYDPQNPGAFAGLGKVNDATRAILMSQLKEGEVYLPTELELFVLARGNFSPDKVVDPSEVSGSTVAFWNLPNQKTELTATDYDLYNIKTVEDLTQFYTTPNGIGLEDREDYDFYIEAYREAIMRTIISDNPDVYGADGDYEAQLQIPLVDADGNPLIRVLPRNVMFDLVDGPAAKAGPKPTPTAAPTPTPTAAPTPTPTDGPTPTPTAAPTPTPTAAPTPTPTCEPPPPVDPEPENTPRPTPTSEPPSPPTTAPTAPPTAPPTLPPPPAPDDEYQEAPNPTPRPFVPAD